MKEVVLLKEFSGCEETAPTKLYLLEDARLFDKVKFEGLREELLGCSCILVCCDASKTPLVR